MQTGDYHYLGTGAVAERPGMSRMTALRYAKKGIITLYRDPYHLNRFVFDPSEIAAHHAGRSHCAMERSHDTA
jgi:predicted site-specific integrase-resolvase